MLPDMEQFALTERAAARIAEIVSAEGKPAGLRVAVLAGGCSGLQYRFELDERSSRMTWSSSAARRRCWSIR